MQFLIFLYFALLGFIITFNNLIYIILWFILGFAMLCLIPAIQKIKIEKILK